MAVVIRFPLHRRFRRSHSAAIVAAWHDSDVEQRAITRFFAALLASGCAMFGALQLMLG